MNRVYLYVSVYYKYLFNFLVHLWRYKNYTEFADSFAELKKDTQHVNFNRQIQSAIRQRENQVCLSFTFWDEPVARSSDHIYEMRSYTLKPGTLFEWGNEW